MNNLWSQKCCELRSHSQYNLKLSISTSLEQRKNVFRREKCFWCPSYSWHRIVSANKTVNKLLRQVSNGRYRHQIPKILFLIIYIYTASWSCRVVDRKLPMFLCLRWLVPTVTELTEYFFVLYHQHGRRANQELVQRNFKLSAKSATKLREP